MLKTTKIYTKQKNKEHEQLNNYFAVTLSIGSEIQNIRAWPWP